VNILELHKRLQFPCAQKSELDNREPNLNHSESDNAGKQKAERHFALMGLAVITRLNPISETKTKK
jgi:hypothetical protein